MRIHKEGILIISIALLTWLAANILVGLTGETFFRIFVFLITTPILILTIRFFRHPRRHIEPRPGCVLAPADGKIVVIEETEETEYFNDQRLQVSVFMSIYNVHINWIPVPGIIKYFRHHNGRFMAAYLPKSSSDNERATTVIEMEDGTEILVRQIAGAVAKRIVTNTGTGMIVSQQDELGFIRFGSRVDLFLPLGSEVMVGLGNDVTGSQTIIARLKSKSVLQE
jgi:phosphatidylserine decarboxylase